MTQNMGSLDQKIRFAAGIAVIAAGFYFQSYWGALGLILIGTAFIKWCPLYIPFKINTKGKN